MNISVGSVLKSHVEGVYFHDYFDRTSWYVPVRRVMFNGHQVEAIVPGMDFTDEEICGLEELRAFSESFAELLEMVGVKELENMVSTFSYVHEFNSIHMAKGVGYRTDRGLYESVTDRVTLNDDGTYIEKVKPLGMFSGNGRLWICRYPVGSWKKNRKMIIANMKGVAENKRGRKLNVGLIFDKKFIKPEDVFEYKLFPISKVVEFPTVHRDE